MQKRRRYNRVPGLGVLSISGLTRRGETCLTGSAVNYSCDGLGLQLPQPLPVGSTVAVDGTIETASGQQQIRCGGEVRWCVPGSGPSYRVGIKLDFPTSGSYTSQDAKHGQSGHQHQSSAESRHANADEADYYELLQLSPNADTETINRVFRILAARYHPDSQTGCEDMFRKIVAAHKVLSNPVDRAAYDAAYAASRNARWAIFESPAVAIGVEAERRKRAGVLKALYMKRTQDSARPGMSLREIEDLLGCPAEHLEFTTWYLKQKQLVARADNGRLEITAAGVDAAEELGDDFAAERKLLPSPVA